MKEERKSVDAWWNNLDELQKGIVRLIIRMIGDAEENRDVVTAKVVDRPAEVSVG